MPGPVIALTALLVAGVFVIVGYTTSRRSGRPIPSAFWGATIVVALVASIVGITAAGDSRTLIIAISGLVLVGGLVAIWWSRRDERDAGLWLLFAIGGAAFLAAEFFLGAFR